MLFFVRIQEYDKAGYPGEEKNHFQGGTAGYFTREFELAPDENYIIQDGELFAHNPTISGVKLEDTILVKNGIYQVLTMNDSWPSTQIEKNGISLERPLILER